MSELSRPLRILSVSAQYYPDLGGVETHVHEVTKRLAPREDFEITVFASDRSGALARSERGEGFDIVRRRSWPRTRDYYFAPGLFRVITSGTWDLVHIQGIHTLVPVLGMIAARVARVPYVVTFHTGGHSSAARSSLRDAQWKVLAPLLRGATTLIGVSRFERNLFERATGIESSRFTVIRNGGALPPVAVDIEPVPGRIVSSGRLERYKGHHRVIEALPLIRAAQPLAHLVILGAGPYETELRDLAASLGVADAVDIHYVQPGDRAGMAGELVRASVMAAFSDYEAHPVAVMEALTLGVPVVGYDIAGIADLVEDGTVTGLRPHASAQDAANALVGAMRPDRDPAEPTAADLPTWEQSADLLGAVYLGAVQSRGLAPSRRTPSRRASRRRAPGRRAPWRRAPWRRPASTLAEAVPEAERLRVVHVSTTLTTGGAERQIQQLVQDGVDDSSVISLYDGGLVGDQLAAGGARVSVLGMAGWRKGTAIARLAAELRRRRPDVVHVHMLSSMLWGLPAARIARVPVIVATEHSLMDSTIEGRAKTPQLRAIYLSLLKLADRCIAVSAETSRRMQEWGVPADRITVIDNGIDFEGLHFSPADRVAARLELGISGATQVILAVGRLHPVKRFGFLLDAMAPLLRSGGRHLVVLGTGDLAPELVSHVTFLGLADAVAFLGARNDVSRWLSAADVLVSPSRDETFGMAVVEALGNGLPVVFGQCPAVESLTAPVPWAHRIAEGAPPDEEASAFAGAVEQALADGRHDVPEELIARYGSPVVARRTADLYRELLGRRRR